MTDTIEFFSFNPYIEEYDNLKDSLFYYSIEGYFDDLINSEEILSYNIICDDRNNNIDDIKNLGIFNMYCNYKLKNSIVKTEIYTKVTKCDNDTDSLINTKILNIINRLNVQNYKFNDITEIDTIIFDSSRISNSSFPYMSDKLKMTIDHNNKTFDLDILGL